MKYIFKLVKSAKVLGSLPHGKSIKCSNEKSLVLAEFDDLKVVARAEGISLLSRQEISIWKQPFKIEGKANEVYISQDRLLLTTFTSDYHAWGFLGPAFLIDLNNGEGIVQIRGENGAALGNGSFIIGLEGYGVFNTWQYDRTGEMTQQWNSYGHYIVDEEYNIRVLERDRVSPTKSGLCRLHASGEVEKGPLLKDSQISQPLVLEDQSVVYIDCGILKVVDVSLEIQGEFFLMEISQEDVWRFSTSVRYVGDYIEVEIYERTEEPPLTYKRYDWQLDLIVVV
ncbi:hypothetical protein MNBD_GAMMA12-2720 [hydrothermal vent metagenome]|uniref:Uncharacterized protein n=1 Tax=hydrothermal vent metagenome TaxID=652676 RepID=A0A3B0Z1V8_9ZZZZ